MREKFPKLAEMIDASREDALACMRFPKEQWAQIASTNPLDCFVAPAEIACGDFA